MVNIVWYYYILLLNDKIKTSDKQLVEKRTKILKIY